MRYSFLSVVCGMASGLLLMGMVQTEVSALGLVVLACNLIAAFRPIDWAYRAK